MYQPQTFEQQSVYRFLSEHSMTERILLYPLSKSGLVLIDETGTKTAFAYQDGITKEVRLPLPSPKEEISAFMKKFRALNPKPVLKDFASITRWWLDHPNPLTHQQALGLSDSLYRHYLTYPLIQTEDAVNLVAKGLVTEQEYQDILLWYFNGNAFSNWLGPLGVDGTGNIYGLTLHYRKPDEEKLSFYLRDDYYCYMNHIETE